MATGEAARTPIAQTPCSGGAREDVSLPLACEMSRDALRNKRGLCTYPAQYNSTKQAFFLSLPEALVVIKSSHRYK